MNYNLNKGFIHPARISLSPNWDERPEESDISLLVIHAISLPPGEFNGPSIENFFLNQLDPEAHPFFETIIDLKVSSHLLVRRSGELVQFVDFNKRAFHAGESEYKGQRSCNDFSIGIELEGSDFVEFEDIQYRVLAQVTSAICQVHKLITSDRIVGHSEISPGRKTDPGPFFNWQRYLSLVDSE